MKTTVDIAKDLLSRAKKVARRDAVTLRELVVEGLRNELERREQREEVEIEPHVVHGRRVPADPSWEGMRELIYGHEGQRLPER